MNRAEFDTAAIFGEIDKTENKELFSFFSKPVTTTRPQEAVTLIKVFQVITDTTYKTVTDQVRAIKESGARQKVKGQNLDFVTFSGVFRYRSAEGLQKASGLVCIDIDKIGDRSAVEQMQERVLKHFQPALMFTSPSGNGLKVIYKTEADPKSHKDYFAALQFFFKTEIGVDIDPGTDITRPCFLCFDPQAYINLKSEVLGPAFLDTFKPAELQTSEINSFQDEDEAGYIARIKYAENWVSKKIGPFEEGQRNTFIAKLIQICNRAGIPEKIVLEYVLQYEEDGFPNSEISGIVRGQYRNKSYFGINPINIRTPIEDFAGVLDELEPVPDFPINDLPQQLQNLINEYTNVFKTPKDYIAASVFFAAALAIGNKLELRDKYDNIPILWLALVGNPSIGKSHPLKTALNYFLGADKKNYASYKEKLAIWEAAQRVVKKDKSKKLTAEASPSYFQYLITDYTPEALFKLHETNSRGVCIYRDELKGWIDDFGRYNKNGGQSTMLSTFYRQPMAINRAGSDPINIAEPVIFVTGGIQPDLLPDLANDKRAESGFLSRLLFVYPDNDKKQLYTTGKMPASLLEDFANHLEELTNIKEVIPLSLSAEAQAVYQNWYNDNVNKTNEEKANYLKAVYGKFDTYVLRFAVVFKGLSRVYGNELTDDITAAQMKAAISIIEYFRVTALKVYHRIFDYKQASEVQMKDLIRMLSKRYGASQNKIAGVLNVSQPYISKILKNG